MIEATLGLFPLVGEAAASGIEMSNGRSIVFLLLGALVLIWPLGWLVAMGFWVYFNYENLSLLTTVTRALLCWIFWPLFLAVLVFLVLGEDPLSNGRK